MAAAVDSASIPAQKGFLIVNHTIEEGVSVSSFEFP
jgi:hypothetical protein